MTTTRERGRPARTSPAQLTSTSPTSINPAPFPDHCVKDAPGLYPIITPPLSGSLMR